MTERERIILGFSDAELLMFHAAGGKVPRLMRCRLSVLLEPFVAERDVVAPRWVKRGPTPSMPARSRKRRRWTPGRLYRRMAA